VRDSSSQVVTLRTIQLAGLPLACITGRELIDHVFGCLDRGQGGWIITANVDHLQRHASNPEIVELYRHADVIVADGAPLVWASRLSGRPLPERIAGSDLVWSLAERAAAAGRTVCLLGGAPGAAEGAAQRFLECFPDLVVATTLSPSVSDRPAASEIDAIRRALEAARPDIVYVALGSPKQERLIAGLRQCLPAAWWIGVGVSLSFVAGQVSRAPHWVQRLGMEWAHRMLQEPRRLMRRYLLNNLPFTIGLLARSLVMRMRKSGKGVNI
jgi:N-acetylglucosaminyldiphosphoundecaprenol N-acetyl-beta-D-mannosaminyltransferase